jgi:glycosyltransferase involved in cell wall biosynthesis
MAEARALIINGDFLRAPVTGVQRVAEELIRGVFAASDGTDPRAARFVPQLWVPGDLGQRAAALGVPYRVVRPLRGVPWQQVTLPLRARGRMVLSLCNVGPVCLREAVTMFHDAQVHSAPQSYGLAFRLWYRFHQPLTGRRHRRILTVSNHSRDDLVRCGLATAERIGVVHNGVDHVLRTPPDSSLLWKLSLQPHRYVLALANAQAHKNIGRLLEAFHSPELSELQLVLFGSADRAAFEGNGLRIPPRVRFAGRVSDAQLRALYEQALCVAFPSLTEGFGLPPLEAMFLGCPAVVSPRGALPEVCGAGALYADPDDTAAWVAAFSRLHRDTAFRELQQRYSLAHARPFTWARAARELLNELAMAAPEPPRPTGLATDV